MQRPNLALPKECKARAWLEIGMPCSRKSGWRDGRVAGDLFETPVFVTYDP